MGGDGLPVKPSAQPTMVRTHHLPPPAKTARGLGFPPPRGPSCLVSSCVIPSQETSPHHGGYGHIADGIGARGAVHRTACSGFRWLTVHGDEPPCLQWITGALPREAWAGGRTDSAVGGRDGRGGVDDAADGLAVRRPERAPAVGAAGSRQRGEPGCERRSRRADGDGPGDRGVAVVRADRLVRAADAPGPPRRRQRRPEGSALTCPARK